MNCVDPIDGLSYREIETQTLRGAYAKAVKDGTRLGKFVKRKKKGEARCRTSST